MAKYVDFWFNSKELVQILVNTQQTATPPHYTSILFFLFSLCAQKEKRRKNYISQDKKKRKQHVNIKIQGDIINNNFHIKIK